LLTKTIAFFGEEKKRENELVHGGEPREKGVSETFQKKEDGGLLVGGTRDGARVWSFHFFGIKRGVVKFLCPAKSFHVKVKSQSLSSLAFRAGLRKEIGVEIISKDVASPLTGRRVFPFRKEEFTSLFP